MDKRRILARHALLVLSTMALSTLGTGAGSQLHAQAALSPEHQRLDFLAGEWRTASTFPDGRVREGDLRYRWVLGGAWMQVDFFGAPSESGAPWGAHVMMRWDPAEDAYVSWVFAGPDGPLEYRGSIPQPGLFRVQRTVEGVTSGIDYRATEDGSVYQENWVEGDGERRVTLRTTYRPSPMPCEP